jgi:transposase
LPGARCELAAEFLTGIRRLDAQLRDTSKKLAAAVKASGTSLTGIFGVGPVIAGTVIGDVRQVFRFPGRDHFAACNGTAPVEVSSGGQKACRLSLRGNRRLNHAIHMAAVTQIRHKHSQGRACYGKKLAKGKTHKEALRSLQRRISDAVYAALVADARQAAAGTKDPGGQPGNLSVSRAAGSHPAHQLFGQATPGPATTLRPAATAARAPPQPNRARQRPAGHLTTASKNPRQPLDTDSKEDSFWRSSLSGVPPTFRTADPLGFSAERTGSSGREIPEVLT